MSFGSGLWHILLTMLDHSPGLGCWAQHSLLECRLCFRPIGQFTARGAKGETFVACYRPQTLFTVRGRHWPDVSPCTSGRRAQPQIQVGTSVSTYLAWHSRHSLSPMFLMWQPKTSSIPSNLGTVTAAKLDQNATSPSRPLDAFRLVGHGRVLL